MFKARIKRIEGAPVAVITLQVPATFSFQAGQYLSVIDADGTHIPLSIASIPQSLPHLELHYRSTPGDPAAACMDRLLAASTELTVSAAQGDVISPPNDAAALLIAGGTGASQVFSCARQRAMAGGAKTRKKTHKMTHILWCVDDADQIYGEAELRGLANTQVQISVDARRDRDNAGMQWLQQFVVQQQRQGCLPEHIVISGSPPFVYACTDVLTANGVNPDTLRSDVYTYAPRT